MKLVPKDEELTFEQWARAKFNEIEKRINICNPDGSLDPVRLNEILVSYSGHYAWCITLQEVEANKLAIKNHEYDKWYKKCYNEAVRIMKTESGGKSPSQITVESRMVELFGDEILANKNQISYQQSKVDLLRGLVKVLERQGSMIQTLSSNMRSELFNTFDSTRAVNAAVRNADAAKSIIRNSMISPSEKE